MLAPLVVAVPVATAGLLALAGHWLSNRVVDLVGAAAAVSSAALAAILVERTGHHTIVYWFGGWQPGRFPLGIAFAVDRFGAGLATLAFVLTTAMLVYSWRYLEDQHHLFTVLVLVFAAGMAGFALSGDLFNMFVFFELMGVAAYALTAYKVEQEPSLQAAFNFAVSNSIGSFLVVLGIALVYGRTGALNLAELGARLGGRHDKLVVVAFTLIVCGFLVKAAITPFHFWLADAYAIAPAPVCVLFAGVMSDLGLYAVARVYWTVFDAPLGSYHHAIGLVLLVIGAATALLGAAMASLQRHLKRLLAYATISELGCLLIGVALLTPDGAAGAALTVLAHALSKGALFLACGLLLVAAGDIDELKLQGRGRRLRVAGVGWLLAALGLAGVPFLGVFTGHALIEDSARSAGQEWAVVVIAVATIVSTGAILRAGARVFLGLGDSEDPLLAREPREVAAAREEPNVAVMAGVTLALALGGLAVGASTGLAAAVRRAGGVFVDRHGYSAAVLHGHAAVHVPAVRWETTGWSVGWGCATALGSVAWAVFSLYRGRLPFTRALTTAVRPLHAIHSGHVGDYIAWLTFGVAVIGGVFALTIR